MSKKTSAKTSTKKATKNAAVKKAAPPAAVTKPAECPNGGSHEWTEESGENFCSKGKEPKSPKTKSAKKATVAKPATDKKMSAIDAAGKLLGAGGEPMNCKAIIDAIAAKGYWTSPGGKTPHATLYSAIIREISVKGKESRFKKTDRGNFAING